MRFEVIKYEDDKHSDIGLICCSQLLQTTQTNGVNRDAFMEPTCRGLKVANTVLIGLCVFKKQTLVQLLVLEIQLGKSHLTSPVASLTHEFSPTHLLFR